MVIELFFETSIEQQNPLSATIYVMSYTTYQEKLHQLRFLIQHQMAGSSEELAGKLSVSKRTVHRMLEHLRAEGLELRYCRITKRYKIETQNDVMVNK